MLLVGAGDEEHVAAEFLAARGELLERGDAGREAALHVEGAAAEHPVRAGGEIGAE